MTPEKHPLPRVGTLATKVADLRGTSVTRLAADGAMAGPRDGGARVDASARVPVAAFDAAL